MKNCTGISFFAKIKKKFVVLLSFFLCINFLFMLTSCNEVEEEEEIASDYGSYGKDAAISLASQFPQREAFSQQERDAAAFLKTEFEKLGFHVEEQTFSSAFGTSTNLIVRISGEGFMVRGENEIYRRENRQVIIGSHYDVFLPLEIRGIPPDDENPEENPEEQADVPEDGSEDIPETTEYKPPLLPYSGIHDSAAGIGVLLSIAKELKTEKFGYDVVLVAFGAGATEQLGSKFFSSQMTQQEKDSTDVMYCIDSIYAGEKVYASAGWNSLIPGHKYEMRRKLYELYDVVYEYSLPYQRNEDDELIGYDFRYNQSDVVEDINGDGIYDYYREVTYEKGDYIPFDQAGIPIVFIESFDYDFPSIEEMKETKNLSLQAYGGRVRGTMLDAIELLEEVLSPDQLERRINSVTFAVTKAIVKGAHDAVTTSEYKNDIRLAPSITVSSAAAEETALTPVTNPIQTVPPPVTEVEESEPEQ